MTRALVLLLLATSALADNPRGRFQRFCTRTEQGRSTRGFLCDSGAFFEAFPASGAGTTSAADCAGGAMTTAAGVAITYSRTGAGATCTKANGLVVSMAANQPRVEDGYYRAEEAATNSVLHNRDGSQTQWAKTNAACTKTATGTDGVINSATVCTASAANGTVLQSLVFAAAARGTSFYLWRVGGTGAVQVTRDNGTTWTTVTLTSTKTRFAPTCDGVGTCVATSALSSSVLNPVVGIRIVTSGDAVAFDRIQDEEHPFTTSAIDTGAAAVLRSGDSAVTSTPEAVSNTVGCASISYIPLWSGSVPAAGIRLLTSTNSARYMYENSGTGLAAFDGTNDNRVATAYYLAGNRKGAVTRWSAATNSMSISQTQAITSSVFTSFTKGSTLALGVNWNGVGQAPMARIREIEIWGNPEQCASSRKVATIGDSITCCPVVGVYGWPARAQWIGGYTRAATRFTNYAASGARVQQAGSGAAATVQYSTSVKGNGFSDLVVLIGINDINAGYTDAQIWAELEPLLNEAYADGLRVWPALITPFGASAGYTPTKQGYIVSVNALVTAWAAARGTTAINSYSALLGSGDSMAAAYDSGDGLHPNAAGSDVLGALVRTTMGLP